MNSSGLTLISPKIVPVLDSDFRPAVLTNRSFRNGVKNCPCAIPVLIAVERDEGSVSHYRTEIYPDDHAEAKGNFTYLERLIKFLLWSRGGGKIYFAGPSTEGEQLKQHYTDSDTGMFDAQIMGDKIYERQFEIAILKSMDEVPLECETTAPLGRHLDGCRIGFDLGASDRKAAAIIDGKSVFSEEIPWDPIPQSDPRGVL